LNIDIQMSNRGQRTTKNEQDSNTKYGFIRVDVFYDSNFIGLPSYAPFLVDVNPGAHGQWWNPGTSASHRGMGARYGRLDCN
jgi:hypothetical protein